LRKAHSERENHNTSMYVNSKEEQEEKKKLKTTLAHRYLNPVDGTSTIMARFE
jgi:hypothetical protein